MQLQGRELTFLPSQFKQVCGIQSRHGHVRKERGLPWHLLASLSFLSPSRGGVGTRLVAPARGRLGRLLSSFGLSGQFLRLATTIEAGLRALREALVFVEALLSSSPEKFGVAVSADALDIFELGISLLDPLPLGFVDLGFRLVFTTRRLDWLRVRSMHLESKSFLGRI